MFACRYTAARRQKPEVLAAIKTIALHNSDLGVFAAVIPFTHYALGTCIVLEMAEGLYRRVEA
jgi:hypothetical protein